MYTWIDSKGFNRFLEILPGMTAWLILLMPFLLAPVIPAFVAYFILAFNLYWFLKALNLARHLLKGFSAMKKNMKIDWLERCKKVNNDFESLRRELEKNYKATGKSFDYYNYEEIEHLKGHQDLIKDYRDIYHVVFITNFQEPIEIAEPTFDAIYNSNYPNDRIIPILCGEVTRDKEGFDEVSGLLKKKFDGKFADLLFFGHEDKPGEVIGKGANLFSAGHKFLKYLAKNHPELDPENILVTSLDDDHLINKEYFARLTYKYIIDPNRDHKTYQPVPVLFNNIWDAPALNRITAVASSLWQIIEAMRPYRLKTFAAHAQSLKTLLVTDFWSNKTIVEDGHQFWRTYFAFNGEIQMVPLLIPVYQDCVLAETYVQTFVNQYKQRRRWAWGISDFPFIIKNYLKHPEIPFGEKFLQTFRYTAGSLSWSTASFLIAFAWVPLAFNREFQDTVLAHNVTYYSVMMARLAWVGIFANMWIYFFLLPPRPKHHKKIRYISMLLQWLLSPIMAIFLSSLPAFESQTRLMLGKYLDYFWSTPKHRKTKISINDFERKPSGSET
jgi:hypothetical protein